MTTTTRPSRRPLHLALVAVAPLSGSACAGCQLGANSVGAPQIKKNAVRAAEVKNGSLTAKDLRHSMRIDAITRVGGGATGGCLVGASLTTDGPAS